MARNEEIRKRKDAQQMRQALGPQKQGSITDVESGLKVSGDMDLVKAAAYKRPSQVMGYSKKQPRQMVKGGSFGYAGPNFNAESKGSNEPEWLTLDNAPRGMGWQERSALNAQLAQNYRRREQDITSLTDRGIQARTKLSVRGMQEGGLNRRQTQRLGSDATLQGSRQAFLAGENVLSRVHDTSEREGKQDYLADEAYQSDVRSALIRGHEGGVNPEVTRRGFEDSQFGFTNFGETGDVVPNSGGSKRTFIRPTFGDVSDHKGTRKEMTSPPGYFDENLGEYMVYRKDGSVVPYAEYEDGDYGPNSKQALIGLEDGAQDEFFTPEINPTPTMTPDQRRKEIERLKKSARKY